MVESSTQDLGRRRLFGRVVVSVSDAEPYMRCRQVYSRWLLEFQSPEDVIPGLLSSGRVEKQGTEPLQGSELYR